ncbi:heat shock transcription factor, X-linked-like [Elephas maximus indicus]|uniref:heat shock transcription factor, X-linked-like n=1 Tax=Elephas maximus indicus TaxID=99487 RepID=UPI002116D00D|nr:heat shock transcription factor, X-linked-like [Elephas maximus indicus]
MDSGKKSSPPSQDPGSSMAHSPPRAGAPRTVSAGPAPPAVPAGAWDDPLPPGCPNGRFLLEDTAFQTPTERPSLRRPGPGTNTLSLRDGSLFSLPFPKKLWNIVSSNQFVSIWWECNGACIGINEKLFQKEILDRDGADKVFATHYMKSFIRQLNLYGFSKMHQIAWRPVCRARWFTEERSVCVVSKLHFYYCPYFKRDFPELLLKMKRRVGVTGSSKAVVHVYSQQRESQPEAPRSPSAPTAMERQEAPTCPSENKPAGLGNPELPDAMPGSSTTGWAPPATAARALEDVGRNMEAAALLSTRSPRQPERTQAPWAAPGAEATILAQPPWAVRVRAAAQICSFGPMVGLQAEPPGYHSSPAMFLPWAGLLPFCCPWVPMPIRAMGPAAHMPVSSPPAMPFHCFANCPCFSDYRPAIIRPPGCPVFRDHHR